MIVESRRIVFNETALRQAIRLYADVARKGDLPQGIVTSVELVQGEPLSATIFIQQSGASLLREVAMDRQKILVALLLLCRSQKIPVPRHAEKTLTAAGRRLVLEILYRPRSVMLAV